jgi:hypothetical protein
MRSTLVNDTNTLMPVDLIHAMRGALRVSKHRQFDKDGKWIPGKVIVAANSGLRKLMRGMRRHTLSGERLVTIVSAMDRSQKRKAHKWQRDEAACEARRLRQIEAGRLTASNGVVEVVS